MTFDKLTQKNARAYFNLYLSEKDAALAELASECKDDNGRMVVLDKSPQSLVGVWRWTRGQLLKCISAPEDDSAKMPVWYGPMILHNPHMTETRFSVLEASLIGKLAYYKGEVLLNTIPGTRWDICAIPKELWSCHPVIWSEFFCADPLYGAITNALILRNDPSDSRNSDKALLDGVSAAFEGYLSYKAAYDRIGKHPDSSMRKKRMVFE